MLTLSSINYYAWKNIEFYFAQYYAYGNDSSHTAVRSCWKRIVEHWIPFIAFPPSVWCWMMLLWIMFCCLCFLVHPILPFYWAIKVLMCPSYAQNVSHTYEYLGSCLLATHPFLISAHSHDHQPKPGHRAQVISSHLMPPICVNKLGHAILSNSISRPVYLRWH